MLGSGFEPVKKLHEHEIKAMGALLNPLYQNDDRMLAAGLFDKAQYDEANEELLERMAGYNKKTSKRSKKKSAAGSGEDTVNKWSKQKKIFLDEEETPFGKAKKELARYCVFMDAKYLPDMRPDRVLGAYDTVTRDPVEPVYTFGPVVKRRNDLPSNKNLADYIDGKGRFDFVKYLTDHKKRFPACFNIGVGQISPHISTEVDCESLFSQAGFLADSRRNRSEIRFYERLVMMGHCLKQIYCDPGLVKECFMERFKNNDWDEKDERDTRDFLDLEREIYETQFPHLIDLFVGEDYEGEQENDNRKGKAGKDNKQVSGKDKQADSEIEIESSDEGMESSDELSDGSIIVDSVGGSDENSL